MTIRWYGLVAPEEAPTGDRRMLAKDMLTYRDFPLYAAWQEVSGSGHAGSVVVGSWDHQFQGLGGVWATGQFLDPTIIPQVTRAMYLLEKKLIGPSIDLDPDFSYEVVAHPERPDEFAMKVTRGNIHGVTFVMGPAFPQVHITVDTAGEMDVLTAAGVLATFATSGVNSSSWTKFPVAPRETTFSADRAIDSIAAWSGGDAQKFASAFLWKDPGGNPLNRETYRLPIVDILDGKAYLIPRAVFSAGVIMSGGHGGLYDTLSEGDRIKVQEVITDIYDMLRDTYADPRVVAPWQRGGRQGADSGVAEPTRVASIEVEMINEELDAYITSRVAAMIAHVATPGAAEDVETVGVVGQPEGEFQSGLNGELERYWTRGEGAAKIRWGTPGDFDRCVRQLRSHFPTDPEGLCANLHHEALGVWPGREHGEGGDHALLAAGMLKPQRALFDNPGLKAATPLVVTGEGHVYGHLATWRQCHMGVGNKCVIAPQSKTNYKWFKTGSVITHDGSTLRIGKITIGTGHADQKYGVIPATEHYDNTGSCIAVVNAGEDSFGVWVAGALVTGVSEDRIAELRRSPLSGDWRRVDGNLELVAALAVNNPGFPVINEDEGGAYSLVAAGVLGEQAGQGRLDDVPVAQRQNAVAVDLPPVGRFGEVDKFLRAERADRISRVFQDLLPPQEGCGCGV